MENPDRIGDNQPVEPIEPTATPENNIANEAGPVPKPDVTAPVTIPAADQSVEKVGLGDTISEDTPAGSVVSPTVVSPDVVSPSASPISGDATPETPAAIVTSSGSAGKKSRRTFHVRLKVLLPIVAIIVLLLAGSAYALIAVILPDQPQNVVLRALSNELDPSVVKSVTFNGATAINDTADKTTLDVTYSGMSNRSGQFDFNVGLDALVTKINFEAKSANGQDFYIKVSGLDGLPQLVSALSKNDPSSQGDSQELQNFAPLLSSINNQWYEIDHSLIQTLEQKAGDQNGFNFTAADRQKLSDDYQANQFLRVQKTLPSQSIAGLSSYHYQMYVDNVKLKRFAQTLKDDNIKGITITNDDIDAIGKTNLAKYPFELWVSKSSKLIDQVKLDTNVSGTTTSTTLTFSKFDQPISVTTPANAQSILQLVSQVYESLTGSSIPPAQLTQLLGS